MAGLGIVADTKHRLHHWSRVIEQLGKRRVDVSEGEIGIADFGRQHG